MQTFPWQQPSGQFSALQVVPPLQRPPVQLSPLPHASQVAPPEPQVVVVSPVSQRLPLQQPWQLVALQVLPLHWLSEHAPPVHALHAWPPLPQAEVALPGRQTPLAQHPPQLAGPQLLVPPPPPPVDPPPVPPPEPLPPPVFPRGRQKPRLHEVSVPHWAQTWPPVPQPSSPVPPRHASVAGSQHPVQLLGLHFAGAGEEHAAPKPSIERSRRRRITTAIPLSLDPSAPLWDISVEVSP